MCSEVHLKISFVKARFDEYYIQSTGSPLKPVTFVYDDNVNIQKKVTVHGLGTPGPFVGEFQGGYQRSSPSDLIVLPAGNRATVLANVTGTY